MLTLTDTLTAIKNQAMGRPVEIHDIYLGSQTAEDSDTLHFANFYFAINFFTYIGHTSQSYTPLGVSRTPVKRSSKGEIERITYKVDNINKAMGAYAAAHDFKNKRIVTRLIFRNALSSYLDAKIVFDGYTQAVVFERKTMVLTCTPFLGSLDFEPAWPYQLVCNAKWADSYCKINKNLEENKKTSTATGGTNSTIIDTALNQADDYWNFGTVVFTSGSNKGYSRKVMDFDSATHTVTLDYILDYAIESGDDYTIYRGCDKTLDMCQNTFGNDINFHGFHTIPLTK